MTLAALVAPITVFVWWVWRGISAGAPRSVNTDLVGPALSSAQAGSSPRSWPSSSCCRSPCSPCGSAAATAGVAGGLVVAGFALPAS